ncbi:hypothetical protein TNIN_22891 [Trichonephila inaurata madagascariensis]|uniref:Uncharacterized protein n=1 Tax=Trichonephila inaurata madagascariensis TaxID=2747483 RepID=A0A8X7C098_9ARAC|nr:hypothetical protein TNIN_22891 [Trichonephila inaurata madagascariensis]
MSEHQVRLSLSDSEDFSASAFIHKWKLDLQAKQRMETSWLYQIAHAQGPALIWIFALMYRDALDYKQTNGVGSPINVRTDFNAHRV